MGHFTLTGLAAAKYQLTASKRGFRTAFYDEHDEFSTAIVTGPDQDTTHLRFKLMPGAVLHGAVTGDDGEPVASARVMLFQKPKHPSDGSRAAQVDATVTDDTGAYEFGDLAAGEYLLAVMAEPWYAVHEGSSARLNPALDVAYPVTYFDSTTEEGSATPLVLAGGGREEANISLHAVPALHIRVDSPGRPDRAWIAPSLQQTVFGLPVGLEGGGNISGHRQNGAMEITGIAPGHYELTQGDPPRIAELDLASSQGVDPNAGSPALSVTGTLRNTSGAPVSGDPTITLARMDGGPGQPVFATQAHRGQFTFDSVPAGQWAVMATGEGTSIPVVAITTGGVRRAGNVVALRDRGPHWWSRSAMRRRASKDLRGRMERVCRSDDRAVAQKSCAVEGTHAPRSIGLRRQLCAAECRTRRVHRGRHRGWLANRLDQSAGDGALPSRWHKRHSIREIRLADPFSFTGDRRDALRRRSLKRFRNLMRFRFPGASR